MIPTEIKVINGFRWGFFIRVWQGENKARWYWMGAEHHFADEGAE
jgi:hypothetical protein